MRFHALGVLIALPFSVVAVGQTNAPDSQSTALKPPQTESEESDGRAERAKALGELKAGWDRAGEPPICVLVGMSWGAVDQLAPLIVVEGRAAARGSGTTIDTQPAVLPAVPKGQSGSLSPFKHLADDLTLNDPYGMARTLRNALEDMLVDAGIDNVIDVDALIESRMRSAAVYQQADERELIKSLLSESPASFVLRVRVSATGETIGEGASARPLLRFDYELKRPGNFRMAGADFHRGAAGSSKQIIERHAGKIMDWFAGQLARQLGQQARGELHMLKLKNAGRDECRRMQEYLERDAGRVRSVRARATRRIDGVEVSDLEVRYAGGSFELYDTMQAVLAERMNIDLAITDSLDGALTLTVKPRAPRNEAASRLRWEVLQHADDPRHAEALALLEREYANEGKPKLAVIVNRELTDAEKRGLTDAELKGLGLSKEQALSATLVAGATSRFRPEKVDQDALDTSTLLSRVNDALLNRYKLIMVDPELASRRLAEKARTEGAVYEDQRMQRLILQLEGFEVLVRILGRRVADDPPKYHYTFDAIRLNDAQILATATESVLGGDFAGGADPMERLARVAVAKLVDQMLTRWTPPRRIEVLISNAKSQATVYAVMDAFETHIRQGVRKTDFLEHRADGASGVGRFYVEWDGDYRSLVEAIEAKKDVLVFDLQTSDTTRDSLSIRVKDGF